MATESIDVLLKEKRLFKPSKEFVEQSNVKKWMDAHKIKSYEQLLKKSQDQEWFWGEMAKETVEWYSPPKKILEWKPPYAQWFVGAKYNIVHDALDKHQKTKTRDKIAYIFEGEPGDVRKITYRELYEEVNKLANALRELGIKKGDRVGIYLPMIPELPISMLACAKIGAIHIVVFSGFSSKALEDRLTESEAKLLITCDGTWRRGKPIELKKNSDEGVANVKTIEHVIVYKRIGEQLTISWKQGRDLWWHDITNKQNPECKTEKMDANDVLFLLYTSGTTGKPKGTIHAHGGYAVGVATTLKWIFDIKEEDIWWCAADIGWITGHSYIVYAPLMLGTTSIIYEGTPDYPKPDRWWEIIEKFKVSILYTSPTAVRMFMGLGEKWLESHDLSSLRLLGSVGEPINPEAWMWYYKFVGKEKCPIMDTWWQTESGMQCISPLPISTLKPGSAVRPFPGLDAAVFDDKGKKVKEKGGHLVQTTPWPAMFRGVYKNPERYMKTYWSQFPNIYLSGDVGRIDKDGYFWVQGREDDVLKVAGHRIGNSEVESALVSHPSVAEAAVVGKPDQIKGEIIVAFVILKEGIQFSDALREELRGHVSKQIGPIAKPSEVLFVSALPKTRSGKIMRRVIRAKLLGEPVGDISTLMNPEAVEEIDLAK